MNVDALLTQLAAANIKLYARGDKLECRAPAGALTEALTRGIRTHKDELLSLLRRPDDAPIMSESATIPPWATDASAPLTHAQERMWFIDRMMGPNHVYNISVAVPLLNRALDLEALKRSCNALLARHAILRTSFVMQDGAVVQVVSNDVCIEPRVIPLSRQYGPSEARERDLELQSIMRSEVRAPFDLSRAPLFRLAVVRIDAHSHILLMMMHHIVSDGWSNQIIVRELTALYGAFSSGREPALPKVDLQYRDYAGWQRQHVDGNPRLARQMSYWKEKLRDLPPLLELPNDRPRPAVARHEGSTLAFQLDKDTAAKLREIAARQRVSLFMLLLATFQVFLSRYSGRADVAVGSPLTNRRHPQLEELVGPCINTVVLRSAVEESSTFAAHLQSVRKTVLEAFDNQDVPFEQIVNALQLPRSLSYEPLVQIGFLLKVSAPGEVLDQGSGKISDLLGVDIRDISGYSKMDLTVMMKEEGETIVGWLEYRTDLFTDATAARMIAHFSQLLASIARDSEHLSDRPMASLTMLPARERHDLLHRVNAPRATVDPLPAHAQFESWAARAPATTALVFEGATWSYETLNAAADRLASRLRSRGAGPGSLVALYLDRCAEAVISILAVLKSGAAYVPVDPAFPQARVEHMLSDSKPVLVLTRAKIRNDLPQTCAPVAVYEELVADDIRSDSACTGQRYSGPNDLAYVIYTSGSTGKPKGVMIEHSALSNFLGAMRIAPGISPSDRLLAVTTLSFDIAGLEILLPLTSGATVVLASTAVTKDAALLASSIRRQQISLLQATPATWRMLLRSGWVGSKSLRAICGGEALTSELSAQLLEKTGSLWNLYGPTEATIWCAGRPIEKASDTGNGVESIGGPIANAQLYILDQTLQPVPAGVAGEICIGGAALARGYLNRPELTSQRFVSVNLDDGTATRVYRTGDMARWTSTGDIEFLGRNDQQVKINGFRVELGEIEAQLDQHPDVASCAVVARADDHGGHRLVAYVVLASGDDTRLPQLRDFCRGVLPEYMVPSQFVRLDAMPLTPNGKFDRGSLPDVQRVVASGYEAPEGSLETAVAHLWKKILKVPAVGRYDDFFALGGHSLLAAYMVADLERETQRSVPVAAVFEAPTLCAFARRIEGAHTAPQPYAVAVEGYI